MKHRTSEIDSNDEKLLVEKCINDDRIYQKVLYKKFAPKMYAICKNYADDRDEAMDILQDGFISVFNNLHKYKFEGSLEGWIRKIIVHKAIDAIRKKKKYLEALQNIDDERFVEAEHFELDINNSTLQKIKNLVNQLPTKAGVILKLYAIEGYTHTEISEILGISIGTSKSQLNRARTLIKKGLAN